MPSTSTTGSGSWVGPAIMAGGTILNALNNKNASSNAANAQTAGEQAAIAEQQREFDLIQQQQAPYRNAGYSGLNALLSMNGLPMVNYSGAASTGGAGTSSTPPSYTSPGSYANGGSPSFGSAGASMPGAMTSTGMETAVNGGYGAYNGGSYDPSTITTGGNTITGDSGGIPLWAKVGAGILGGIVAGPQGALAGYQLASSGDPQSVSFNGQNINTDISKTNLQPTSVTLPKTTLTTPGQIINPATGAPYGASYANTPEGAKALFHEGIANGQMNSEAQNNLMNSFTATKHSRAKFGGPVGDAVMPSVVKVGEDGEETLHMAPGSVGWVEPNPRTLEKARRGKLPRSDGDIPGRMLGGLVGNNMGDGGIANSLAFKRAAIGGGGIAPTQQTPIAQPTMGGVSSNLKLPTYNGAPSSGPVQNAIGSASAATWRPTGSTGGFGSASAPPAYSGPTQQAPTGSGAGVSPSGNPNDPAAGFYDANGQPLQNPGGEAGGYNFRTDPGYNFNYDEGLRAVQQGLGASGLLNSTGAIKEMTRYGQGQADQEFNTIYNRIAGVAGIGQTANQTTNAAGENAANNISNSYGNIGNAGASGYINGANALNNGWNNGVGLYGLSQNGYFNGGG
jgi:hypothetical protein